MNNMLPTPASEDVPLSSSSSVTAHDSAAPATNTTRAPISAPETAHLSRTSSNATRAEYTSTTMPKTFTPIKTNEESNAITSKVEGGASASAKEPELIKSNSNNKPNFNKGSAFWMIMLSLAMSMFLSALDLTALSTALPRIATDLESENFTWIGSAYALASTAFCKSCISLTPPLPPSLSLSSSPSCHFEQLGTSRIWKLTYVICLFCILRYYSTGLRRRSSWIREKTCPSSRHSHIRRRICSMWICEYNGANDRRSDSTGRRGKLSLSSETTPQSS